MISFVVVVVGILPLSRWVSFAFFLVLPRICGASVMILESPDSFAHVIFVKLLESAGDASLVYINQHKCAENSLFLSSRHKNLQNTLCYHTDHSQDYQSKPLGKSSSQLHARCLSSLAHSWALTRPLLLSSASLTISILTRGPLVVTDVTIEAK